MNEHAAHARGRHNVIIEQIFCSLVKVKAKER